jgi:hemolysin activation/secretion protein
LGAVGRPLGAGGQLQQIPPVPVQPKSIPDLRVEHGQPPSTQGDTGARITLRALHVTGETRFTEAQLIAASGFRPGGDYTLGNLRTLAGRISDFYNHNGFFVAQAYLPAQSVKDGAVTITVIEGRYGKIALNNKAHVSSGLAHSVLSGLKPGDVVAAAPLERRLLLLSDLPGVAVNSTLTPGEAVGTSDLLVALTPGRRITGSLEADNAGNPYTGEYRGGGTINFNEITGHGDVASLRVLSSGSGLNYVRGSYETRIQDATVGVAYSYLSYRLGRQFSVLDATGTAGTASVYGSYPLIRSQNNNLYALLDFDARTFRDKIGATSSVTDKTANVVIAGLSGDHSDHLWGGGTTYYSASWSAGDLDIKTPVARALDDITARTNGSYGKFSFQASRLQTLGGPLSLFGEARGQMATKNLDTSEKMELGGAYGVRAYPEGEAYGDQGYILTLEARLRLAALSRRTLGEWQAAVFVDNGSVTLNRSAWAPGPNRRTLSAAGVGLTWFDPRSFVVKVSYAFKLGDEPALSAPDRSGRLWVQLTKFF